MKLVKIKNGYYGAKLGNSIKPKCKDDEPFALDDKEADRIVSLGIAEYADKTADTLEDTSASQNIEYDDTTGMNELKSIAKSVGLSVPFGISKTALKDLLDEHLSQNDGELPSFEAENPII